MNGFEEIIEELRKLSRKKPFPTKELERAKELMRMRRGPWVVKCDKCGMELEVKLTTEDISDLLTKEYVLIEYSNPNCIDQVMFIPQRHKMRITLIDLIESLIY